MDKKILKREKEPFKIAALSSFKREVSKDRLVSFWTSCDQLQVKVSGALSQAVRDNPRTGWVRGNEVASSVVVAELHETREKFVKAMLELERARAALEPDVSNLAGFEDPVTFQYDFRLNYRSSSTVAYFDTTWKDVFIAVAPQFFRPSTPGNLEPCLRTMIYEALRRTAVLRQSDVDLVKIQLLALKLLRSITSESAQGGVLEFLEVTPLGKKTLVELRAVRRTV